MLTTHGRRASPLPVTARAGRSPRALPWRRSRGRVAPGLAGQRAPGPLGRSAGGGPDARATSAAAGEGANDLADGGGLDGGGLDGDRPAGGRVATGRLLAPIPPERDQMDTKGDRADHVLPEH